MIVEGQQAAVALLMNPAIHRIDGPVEAIETHISRIFLAGDRAYKMKRAVKLPYVDFSTPELRLSACSKEVELNAKTAPGLYLGVRRVTREADGTLALDGAGELTDAVIEMKQFDQSTLLDRMALAGALTPPLMTEAARMIAHFHRGAPIVHTGGGAVNFAGVLDINKAGFSTSHVFDESAVEDFDKSFRTTLAATQHCSTVARRPEGCGAATVICTCATFACSTVGRACSTASNSTIRSRQSTCCTILLSC